MSSPTRHSVLRLLLPVMIAGASACGESSSPIDPETPPPQAPVDAPSLVLSSGTAAFSALRGAPAPEAQIVEVTNGGGGSLTGLSAKVAYGAGEPAGWLTATLSGTTAPATLTLTASTTATDAGTYNATVTMAADGSPGSETVNATLSLAAGSAPTIVVTSPSRAAMLQQGDFGDSDVQITGEACHDSLPITELDVNGVSVPVGGLNLCEAFDVTQSSPWGLSTIAVHAASANGRSAEVVQSYLRSPAFQPAMLPLDALGTSVFVQLNQPTLDDSDPDLDDLATVMAAEILPGDVYAAMPTPLWTGDVLQGIGGVLNPCTDELRVEKRGLSWQHPSVSITAHEDDLWLEVTMATPSLSVAVAYTGCLGNTTTVIGSIAGSQLTVKGPISVGVQNGALNASATLSVDLTGAVSNVNTGGFIGEVTTMLANTVLPHVIGLIETRVEGVLGDVAVVGLQSTLSSFSLAGEQLVNGRAVAFNAGLDFMDHGLGYVRIGLASVTEPADVPPEPAPAFGTILTEGQGGSPDFDVTPYGFGIGLRLDAINQLLWSAWRAGAFDAVDLAAQVGVAGVGGSVSALLPPVLAPGTVGQVFEIAWGDLAVSAEVDPTVFGASKDEGGSPILLEGFASARLGLSLAYDDVEHRLQVAAITPEVQVQVAASDQPLDEAALGAAIGDALEGMLSELIPSALAAVSLPAIDFATATFALENAILGRDGNYLTLTGDVVAR